MSEPLGGDTCSALQKLTHLEAELLDQRRFEEWLDLYADDAIYWVPAARGQTNPTDHVSLFYDDKQTMIARITRLRHPELHAQTPAARMCRLITNINVEPIDGNATAGCATSNHMIVEYRPGRDQRIFAGHCRHEFANRNGRWLITQKRLDLINCDASFAALTVPL